MAQIDIGKFEKVFNSIEKQLVMQSSFLESMYRIQSQQLEMDREREEDQRRREAFLAIDRNEFTSPSVETSAPIDSAIVVEKASSGIGSFLGAAIASLGLLNLAKFITPGMVFKAGTLALLAPAIGDFVAGAAETALDGVSPNTPEFNKGFADTIGTSAKWATIGSTLGGRVALIFGAAGAGSELGDKLFEKVDSNKDGIVEAFGLEFKEDTFKAMGGAVGGALGLALPGIMKAGLKPVFAGLTGPVGLTALSAAALLGGVALFDEWMNNKRDDLINDINTQLKDGLEKFKNEKDRSIFSRIWTGFVGADKSDDLGAQLQELESILRSEYLKQNPGQLSEFGDGIVDGQPLDISKIEDKERRQVLSKTQDVLGGVLSTTDLDSFSLQKLEQLGRITSQLGLTEENAKIASKIQLIKDTLERLNEESAASMQSSAEAMSSAVISPEEQAAIDARATAAASRRKTTTESSILYRGDSNQLIDRMIRSYVKSSEGVDLSPADIQLKLNKLNDVEGIAGSSGQPVLVDAGGNVTKGGDVYNDNRQTISMLANPERSLSSYSQFTIGVQ